MPEVEVLSHKWNSTNEVNLVFKNASDIFEKWDEKLKENLKYDSPNCSITINVSNAITNSAWKASLRLLSESVFSYVTDKLRFLHVNCWEHGGGPTSFEEAMALSESIRKSEEQYKRIVTYFQQL